MNIPNEEVEAAAQALWQVHPLTRENVRSAARRALQAAKDYGSPEVTEQKELAIVLAASDGWEREDLTTDLLDDYLQTASEVLAAGFRKSRGES